MKQETHLEQMLDTLRSRLLLMCSTTQQALDNAWTALQSEDREKAEAIIDNDSIINNLENEIDTLCLSILARTQPVAGDLRFVISALRMVLDLERIGDEAVSIAERVLLLQGMPHMPILPEIKHLMDLARQNYREATRAVMTEDTSLAIKICRSEDEGAQAEVKALQKIMDKIADSESKTNLFEAMHNILISRALNRIIRRSANIAEHAWFIAKGESIKHKRRPE